MTDVLNRLGKLAFGAGSIGNLYRAMPDDQAFEHASTVELKPVKLSNTLAFMFETRYPQRVTKYAATVEQLQDNYIDCWRGLKKHFDPTRRDVW